MNASGIFNGQAEPSFTRVAYVGRLYLVHVTKGTAAALYRIAGVYVT